MKFSKSEKGKLSVHDDLLLSRDYDLMIFIAAVDWKKWKERLTHQYEATTARMFFMNLSSQATMGN